MSEDKRQPASPPSLERLSERIAKKRRARSEAEEEKYAASPGGGAASGLRAATDVVAGIAVALVFGWGLDRLLGTSPWLLLASIPLGMAAGIVNAWRSAQAATQDEGPEARAEDETS